MIALPKPNKPTAHRKSCRPISLLWIPYKILKRFIYARVKLIIDVLLPRVQARFLQEKSTADKVTHLIQEIDNSFSDKEKAGAVCVNLTVAYDSIWYRDLTRKLLRLLPIRSVISLSWSLSVTAVLPSSPVLESRAGCIVLRMAFYMDQS